MNNYLLQQTVATTKPAARPLAGQIAAEAKIGRRNRSRKYGFFRRPSWVGLFDRLEDTDF